MSAIAGGQSVSLWQWWRPAVVGGLGMLFVAATVAGVFAGPLGGAHFIGVGVLMIALVAVGLERWLKAVGESLPWPASVDGHKLELAVVSLVPAFGLLEVAGPLAGPLYPLIYALVALLVMRTNRVTAALIGTVALTLEIACHVGGQTAGGVGLDPGRLASHLAFLTLVAAVGVVFGRSRSEGEPVTVAVGPATPDTSAVSAELAVLVRDDGDAQMMSDAAASIDVSIRGAIALLLDGLECQTVSLFWVDSQGRQLELRQAVGETGTLAAALNAGQGAIASVIRGREPVRMSGLRPGARALSHHASAPARAIQSFLGVPVEDDDHPLGVLCLDRAVPRPFTDAEEAVASDAARSIVRTLTIERALLSADKTRQEMDCLYEASRELNGALTPDQVYEVALARVREITDFDFAAVLVTAEREGCTTVVRAEANAEGKVGAGLRKIAEGLRGRELRSNAGLVSMAMEMGHTLPYNGDYRSSRSVVFSKDCPLVGLNSLVVMPLTAQDTSVGALIFGCIEKGAFPKQRREMLEVVANQVAISLHNARLYEKMEQMATIDGLTNLSNHRTLKQRLGEVMARSRRGAGDFCFLLSDIDHFKSVNDTYGHPMGDEVLRQVSRTLREVLRETDIPARYGGEEFGVILEGTELDGAQQIANRLRTEIEALTFNSPEHGAFSISMSFGVALFPNDGEDGTELIDHADKALYYAKTHGRNQVRAWRDICHDQDG